MSLMTCDSCGEMVDTDFCLREERVIPPPARFKRTRRVRVKGRVVATVYEDRLTGREIIVIN